MAIKNIYSGLFILLVCMIGFISTSSLESAGEHVQYGPAFFPNMLLYILTVGGLFLLGKGCYSHFKTKQLKEKNSRKFTLKQILSIVIFWLTFALYIIIFTYTGFAVSTIFFLIAAQLLYGRKKYLHVVMIAILSTGAIYFILAILFDVPLPLIIF